MKILQLCPKPLNHPLDGGKIAMLDISSGLKKSGCELTQLIIETPGHLTDLSENFGNAPDLHKVFIDTRPKLLPALWALILGKSYNLSRFRSQLYFEEIEKLLSKKHFDVIQGEGIYTLTAINRIRKICKTPVVLRSHNVEFLIWERMALSCKNPFKGFYLKLLSKQLKKEELQICRQVDAIVAISEIDKELFKAEGIKGPFHVCGIGSGLEPPDSPINQTESRQIFHLGSMNWMPNIEGVQWFLDKVWPVIMEKMPDLKLLLAGRDIQALFQKMLPKNTSIGEASDARDFMLKSGIMIVPLLSGSGIRVKIIEGLKLGKVIITTKVGAEGLSVQDGREILIAENALEFANKVLQCFTDPQLVLKISENALKFASEHFNTVLLADDLVSFYKTLPCD